MSICISSAAKAWGLVSILALASACSTIPRTPLQPLKSAAGPTTPAKTAPAPSARAAPPATTTKPAAPRPPAAKPSSKPAPPKAAKAPAPAAPAQPTTPSDAARATQLRAQGLEALNKGEVSAAVSLLQQASALDPNNALIKSDLARAQRISQTVSGKAPVKTPP